MPHILARSPPPQMHVFRLVMLFSTTILKRCAVGVKVATRTNQPPVRGVELNAVADIIGAKPCIAFPERAMQ